ncbi:ROK family protein [Mycetocola sp.]|uniref:ROK family protein n=1 Tax=Mycetocola sp. TaxID=1871042 RepID=UPI00398A0EBA
MDQNYLGLDQPTRYPRTSLAVAVEVLVHGPRSRAQLADRMNLSPASLTRLVKPLIAGGVLIEAEPVRSSALGRSSLLLDVVDDYRFIGVKLTADTAFAVLTDLRAQVLDSASLPLSATTPDDVVRTIQALVRSLARGATIDGVGITLGGRVRNGVVVDSPYLGWKQVELRQLASVVLDAPVHVDNDVIGLTNAEHWFGWGRGFPGFALLTIGAGIGYGLVLGDALVPTETGPVGHLPIDQGGPVCPSGHRGCLAAYATVGSITAAASVGHQRTLGFDEVIALAQEGDLIATRVLSDAAWAVGRAASMISDVTSVRRVILSGEAVPLAETAGDSLAAGLNQYRAVDVPPVDVVIQPADFFEWARGAAVVALQREFPRAPGPRAGIE